MSPTPHATLDGKESRNVAENRRENPAWIKRKIKTKRKVLKAAPTTVPQEEAPGEEGTEQDLECDPSLPSADPEKLLFLGKCPLSSNLQK